MFLSSITRDEMSESESVAGTADCQSVRHEPKCRFIHLSAIGKKNHHTVDKL